MAFFVAFFTLREMNVTQRNIGSLPIGIYRLDRNLYLRVRLNTQSFIFRLTVDGKCREKAIGSTKKLTLAAAKMIAEKMRVQAASGIDIFAPEKKKQTHLFKDEAPRIIDMIANASRWRYARHKDGWIHSIETYAYPLIGEKEVNEITRDDICAIIEPIWESKNETASKLRGRLEKIFDYLTFIDLYTHPNPARWKGGLSIILPSRDKVVKVKHREAPTFDELSTLSKRFITSNFASHQAIVFGILTAARVNEFLLAKWDEIDFENAVWNCPRRKDGKDIPHRVPLCSQLLTMLKTIEHNSDYVFPNKIGKAMCIDTPRQILRKNLQRQVTMHGCRSTFRDWCAENGIDRVLAEKSLMHATGGAVELAYQRSDLLEQRRPIMQSWADALLK